MPSTGDDRMNMAHFRSGRRGFLGTLAFGAQHADYGYLGQAHTDGDLYVYFREANVLVAGGVVSAFTFWQAATLIGWDIACTDQGPMIVEMNECPDSFISQFADRRGLLDETLQKFIAFQDRERTAFNEKMKVRFKGH